MKRKATLFIPPLTERTRSCPTFWGTLLILISCIGFSFSSFGQAANIDQAANGKVSAPTSPMTWQNGNLNTNNSHYIEGQSVPYRLVMTGMTPGQPVTLTLQFDITHGAKYALDFITGYNWLQPHNFNSHTTPESIDPTIGTAQASTSPTSYLRVTAPAYLSSATPGAAQALATLNSINGFSGGVPVGADNNQNSLTLWGASFDQAYGITYSYDVANVLVLNNVNQSVSFTIKFTPTGSTAVLAWGGHISRRQDWGTNPIATAGGISGSPYHMRRIDWTYGQLGNADMQMQIALSQPICPSDLNPAISICANSSFQPIACPASACAGSTLYYSIPIASGADTYSWSVSPSTGVTIANPTSANTSITYANSGSYTVTVTLNNSSGIVTNCAVPVTINPAPPCTISGLAAICSGGTSNFSGPANMDSYSWTGPGGFTSSNQSTGPISLAGTYSLTTTKNGCSSTCTQDLTVNQPGGAPVTTPAARCGAGTLTLGASGSLACDSLIWFSDAGLTTRVNVGSSYSPNVTGNTTFYVLCKSINGCVSTTATVLATVNPVPVAPTTTPASRCGAGAVTLGASGSANCDSLIWFSDAGLTTRVNVGSSFSPNLSATTTYWVVCKSAAGCVSSPATVIGTVNPGPAAPTTTPAARCGSGTVTLGASGSANCDSLIWFSDAGLTTRVNVGSSYSPNLSATTTFWVICKTVNGCTSSPATVIGTVNPNPSAPTTTPAARCGAGTVALGASGSANCDSLIWFSDAGLTTRVNVGSSYSPNLSATTTFWVICKSVNGCTSAPATVIGTVNPNPAAPTTTPAARCGAGVVTLGASGSANCDSLIWFSDAGLTTRVNVGSSYSPNLSATTTFWVICKSVNGCTSTPATVIGTVNPNPAAPTTTPAARCGAGVVTLGASGSANCDSLIWYNSAALTTRVNVGSSFSPNISATTTYWVVCKSVNGCTSAPTTVVGTVNPNPAAPTTTPAARCGAGVVTLGASGSANCDSLIWFSDAGLTTRVNVGSSYAPNISATTTFWVICKSVNGCVSSPATVIGTVNPNPAAPTTTPAARCGSGVVTLGASGSANCDSLIWFSDAGLTTRVNVGSSYSPNLSATTTFWVICKSVNGCTSAPATVVGTVNPNPAAPTTTPAARCGAGVVTLGASGSANCDSLIWYNSAALTTRVNVGSSFSPNISATTTYWVVCKSINGCTSAPTTVIGTVNPIPAAPTTTPAARCGSGVVTLGASGSANCDSLIWFSDAGLTTRVNVGSSYAPNISATTTFWVICKSVNGCVSSPATVIGTVNPNPSAPTTTPAARCGAGVVTLGASGSANCDSLIWFSDAGLTTRVNVGSSFSPNISATTTYWVICKSINGCVSAPSTVVGTVNPIPAAPTTTPAARCGAGVVTLGASGSANCDSLIWYNSAALTTRVNVGSSFSPNISATTTYWVVCKSINGCTSAPTTVIGTVNPIPAAPTTTPAARCGAGVVTLGASGSANCDSLIWFSDAGLTTRVNTGSSYSPNLSATTTYWVICKSVNGCVSSPATVIGTVNPIPAAPTTTPATRCGTGVVTLGASGSANCDSLIWFSDAGLTTRVNVGSSYAPNLSATTTFWVICKSINGCVSASSTVVGTVNPIPAAPTTTPAARCGAGVVTLGASGSANCDSLIWFSDAGLTTRVNVGSSYAPNISATTTYWVICKSVNGCVSAPSTVVGTVNPIPAAPTTTPAARCGAGVVTLGASGSANCDSLIWFSDAGLTTRVNVGSSYSPNLSATTTYWVICKSINGCVSTPATVIGTVNPIPAAPTTTPAARCGAGVVTLGASGSANCDSLIWFSDAGLTTRVNVGSSYSPNLSATTTYWVICKSINGCVSTPATVIGTVNPIPAAPNTTPAARCGSGVVTLGASGSANCDSLIWYNSAALTTRVNVGSSYSPNLSATTTFWVVCKSINGCTSAPTTVVGTVNPIPAAPTTTPAARCGAGVVTLGASGSANCDSLIWFSDAGLTTRVNTGSSYSPNLSATTTYWVICKSVNGCVSSPATVIGTVNPIPAAPTTTPAARCGSGVVTLGASGSANCDSLIWFSDAGLTTRVNVGSSYAPNISATTTYWVICKSINGCVSASSTVVGTVNPIPAAPNTTPAARCGAGVVTLGASGSANCDSLIWYNSAALTTRVNVGSSYSPNLSATTTFWVVCKSINGCTSAPTTVIGTVNPIPAAPTTTPAARCGAGVVTLGASGSANCDSLIWFSDAGLTTRVNVGSSYAPNLSATTTFWVICKSINGCVSSSATVIGTVNPIPAAPTTTPAARCGSGVVTLGASGSANCDSLIWFSDAGLTTRVNTGSSYSPNLSATTTFWVICKSVNGCVSGSSPVIGTVNPIPAAPTTNPAARCGAGVVILGATGSANCDSLIWYNSAALTTRVNVGNVYSPNLSATTTFWVVCKSVNGCTSAPATVIGTVNPIPAAPTVTPAAHCGPGVATMFANGGANCDSLIWFSDAGLLTRVNAGGSYSPNLSATTSFWVICKSLQGCLSAPAMVTDTTNPIPVLQMEHNIEICKGKLLTLVATPVGGTWTSPLLGTLAGGIFDTHLVGPGTYTVRYSFTNQFGCIARDSVQITVKDCGFVACTYTQGYYGGKGKACDGDTVWNSPILLINHLLNTNLIIGIGPKSIMIPIGTGSIVNAVMPGGSTPKGLVYTGQCTISTVTGSCFQTNYLTKQGRINNVLLSQTIALSLNARMHNGILATMPIKQGTLITQGFSGNCGDSVDVGPCGFGTDSLSSSQMNVSVVNYLTNFGANNATVANLLVLANSVLGGALTPGQPGANNITVPSYSDINDAVSFVNQTFDECNIFVGYNLNCNAAARTAPASVNSITAGHFTVYPNPTTGMFTIESPTNIENAVITVSDLNGRVIATQKVDMNGRTVFNLQNVTRGIYVINISDGKDSYHIKIMVL